MGRIRLNFSNTRIMDITECEWKDLRIVIEQMKINGTASMPLGFIEASYGCAHISPTPCPHTWNDGNKAWGCVLPDGHDGEHSEIAG